MKKSSYLIAFLIIVSVTYLAGPKPEVMLNIPEFVLPETPEGLERWIENRENGLPLKPNNHARIVWANPETKEKTEFVLVYIHGFSASYGEGFPVHEEYAKRYGMNVFIARLAQHGLSDVDAFQGLKAEDFVRSAFEAVEIGKRLGNRVVLMGTSMGGALSLHVASHKPNDIHALFLFSPLVDFYDKKTIFIDKPWGKMITRWTVGGNYFVTEKAPSPGVEQYWYTKYHIDGLLAVTSLVRSIYEHEPQRHIKCPTWVGYYFKNENEQDKTVSVSAILEMANELSVDSSRKMVVNFEEAGAHVITSEYSTNVYPAVADSVYQFSERVLGLVPVQKK